MKIKEAVETLRVKWIMLDAQQKQVILIMAVSLYGAIFDALQKRIATRNMRKKGTVPLLDPTEWEERQRANEERFCAMLASSIARELKEKKDNE